MPNVVISGSFDDLDAHQMRLLHEASHLGALHVLLWTDRAVEAVTGRAPKFDEAEREYLIQAVRYVSGLSWLDDPNAETAQVLAAAPDIWAVSEDRANAAQAAESRAHGIDYRVIPEAQLAGFPLPPVVGAGVDGRKRVLVTGCYDWLHSGHVRFFEEVSGYGELYVVVGNDANVTLLKGEGHPMFGEDQRRYMVQSIRYVTQALVSSGMGWMDAIDEIALVKPDIYAVNEDGDKPEKQAFCDEYNLEYLVLKRTPKEGLERRTSTNLRGF